MPYKIKLTKTQKELFKKEIMGKLKTLDGEDLREASKFLDEMSKQEKSKVLTHDEYLVTAKAKICQDEYCKKVIQEVLTKNAIENNLEQSVQDFLKSKTLPKTNPKERLEVLKTGQDQILERQRMLITEKEGTDPDPKFVGNSEDGTEGIFEQYVKCRNCHKVFKTFKNGQIFCSPNCRKLWFSKNMKEQNAIEDKIESENNNETWNWERDENGKFRRVYL
jgi:endogenous inhibitor of DNA gyrase (YacG/DUF329 family)